MPISNASIVNFKSTRAQTIFAHCATQIKQQGAVSKEVLLKILSVTGCPDLFLLPNNGVAEGIKFSDGSMFVHKLHRVGVANLFVTKDREIIL